MNHGKCSTFSSQHKHCQAEIFFGFAFCFFLLVVRRQVSSVIVTTIPLLGLRTTNQPTNVDQKLFYIILCFLLPPVLPFLLRPLLSGCLSCVFFTFHNPSLSLCVQCPSTLLCHSFLLPSNFLLAMEQPAVMVLVVIATL